MKSRTLMCFTAMTLFAVLAIAAHLAAQDAQDRNQQKHTRYSIRVFGTLGGLFDSEAHGLNNRGSVAGQSFLSDGALHAFFWRKGTMTDLGTLGGPDSFVSVANHTVNERDVVVGYSETSIPDPNQENFCNPNFTNNLVCLPFVWENGVMTALPTLGGTNGQAFGINNRGQIAGQAEGPNPDPCSPFPLEVKPVIWRNGQIQQVLAPFGGSAAGANAINDNGDAVGISGCITGNLYAVLWRHGSPIDLGSLGGVAGNVAFDINDRGQVIGQSDLPGDTLHHGFLWQDGVMIDLGSLSGLPTSLADGINKRGQVVGFSQDANGDDFSSVAWLWQNGTITDLNTVIPGDSSLFLMEAVAINDGGQIAGWGRLSNGEIRPFLLTPCNESDQRCEDSAASATESPSGVLPDNFRETLRLHSGFNRAWLRASEKSARTAATVTAAPIASLSPSNLTFSTQAIGTTSAAETVTLKNTGTTSLTITSIAIIGTNAGDFAQTHTCGGSLAAAASCTISVRFKPTASGTRTAALSITDNAAGSPQEVSLTGSGTTAKLSPTGLIFGTIAIGTARAKTVTLTNVGAATLTITAIAITGTNAGDFAQTHTCGSSLAPGASCAIRVTFKPTASGARMADLSVTDNAAGSPQHVPLSGIGTTAKFSPTNLNFGSVAVGTTSPAKTVTLTNVGTTMLTITAIAITGTNAGDFAQTHTCGSSLAVGASCSISITLRPTASGARSAALSVSDNAAGSPQKVSLSGTGVAGRCIAYGGQCPFQYPPCCPGLVCTFLGNRAFCEPQTSENSSRTNSYWDQLNAHNIGTPRVPLGKTAVTSAPTATLSPTSLTFSAQAIDTTSAAKTVTLKNTGTSSLTISSIAITGTNAGDFAQTHTCGSSLAAGASCKISVKFKPTASATRMADLSVTDNAAGSPQHVPLSGIGTTAKLSPTGLNFGFVAIGKTSQKRIATLTNVGRTTLTISGVAITGTNAGDFAQTHTCGSSLAAGTSCTISVAFKPTQIGKRTGVLSVTDNAPGSPQTVSLSGTGTHVELVPNQLSFACFPISRSCACSTSRITTLTNLGSTTLNISGIAISGPFSQTNTCGASVAAGSSCNIDVSWPRLTGDGAVSISDNGGASPQTVPLSGDNQCSPH
jgi:probable HAF family extracellular repeat protein